MRNPEINKHATPDEAKNPTGRPLPTGAGNNSAEGLSTEVTEEDLAEAITDEHGVKYSRDGLRLLRGYDNLNLVSYAIRPGTRVICSNAFAYSYSLREVTLAEGVTVIGKGAFYRCFRLESVAIPDSVHTIGSGAFCDCYRLQSVTIPDAVTAIERQTFSRCRRLRHIHLPDSLTTIGERAFWGCRSLECVTLPPSLTTIERGAFSWCAHLSHFDCLSPCFAWDGTALYDANKETLIALIRPDVADFQVPDSVTVIADEAFDGCLSLKAVSLPDSITTIGEKAFGVCISLPGKMPLSGAPTISNLTF